MACGTVAYHCNYHPFWAGAEGACHRPRERRAAADGVVAGVGAAGGGVGAARGVGAAAVGYHRPEGADDGSESGLELGVK